MGKKRKANRRGYQKVEKIATTAAQPELQWATGKEGRGYTVITGADLIKIRALDKNNEWLSVPIQTAHITLDPLTALQIYQRCAPVFAVVSSRANRVSSLEWHVIPTSKKEDRIVNGLKYWRDIYNETESTISGVGTRIKAYLEIHSVLPDIKLDLSNFDASLRRWSRALKARQYDRCQEIEDFLGHPSPGATWASYVKKLTQDLLIHGSASIYKQPIEMLDGSKIITNLHPLPGGTVIPIMGEFVGELRGYVQMTDGSKPPQLFFDDEVLYDEYMPNSGVVSGMKPLDALINLVAENMLFNELMANQADGSKPPEKLLVFGEKNPGLDISDPTVDYIDKDEQRRVETKLNRSKREAAVAILSGYGTPFVLDMTRSDTIPTQMQRQDQINKYVAMVFNASNQEINETGGDGTSGRNTSETQERNDNSKGIRPIIKSIEEMHNHGFIPYAFGPGYSLEFTTTRSDEEEITLAKMKKDSGLMSVNEIRVRDMNLDPIQGEEYEKPQGQTPQQQTGEMLGQIQESLKSK